MTARRIRMPIVFWVALGSALGACLRWALGLALNGTGEGGFPWTTLLANALGSAAIGLYAALSAPDGRLAATPAQRQFAMAGVCGGFTTFSLFSGEWLQAVLLGESTLAAASVAVSVPLWLLGVWAGHAVGLRINRMPTGIEERAP